MGDVSPVPGYGLPDENLRGEIIAGTTVTTLLAIAVVAVRFWVRARMVRSIGWDDYWILAAMILSFIGFCIVIASTQYGAGRHVYHILQDPALGYAGMIKGLELNYVTQYTYIFGLSFTKISIGLFLIRLTPSGIYKIIVYCVLGLVSFYTVVGSVALLATCRPFAANFDRTIPGASCYSAQTSQALAFTNQSLGILTDLILAVIPVPLLWKLQINNRVKLSVIAILSLGLFAASASIVKLYYVTGYGQFGDFLWDSKPLTLWSATEVNIAIIAASIPALKPLFKTILGSSYNPSYPNYPSQKNGYAQHSRGPNTTFSSANKSRVQRSRVDEEFEMHGTNITAAIQGGTTDIERNKLGGFSTSEESILPLHSNSGVGITGIMKTTQVYVKTEEAEKPRSVEDRF